MERHGGRGRAAFLPHERRVLWTEKENHRKKSSCFTQLSRTQKFPGLPFLRSRCFSGLCKSVSSALRKRMEYYWFEERKRRFVRFTSKTLCRLHLIVLVDLIMFTHIKQHIYNIAVTCFFPRGPLSQIQCSTSRLAASCCVTPGGTGTSNAHKRGARHHAVPHGRRHMLVLPMQVNERL